MKKLYAYFLLAFLGAISFISCQTNHQKSVQFQDSLMSLNSSDSSILLYADGLEKLKSSLNFKESPVYSKDGYSFYTSIYQKDSLPVIYSEYGETGNGFVDKKYYLEKGELVLYVERAKQSSAGEKPEYEFKESRIFFRNNVFLKAEERVAKSDSLLNQMPFSLLDEHLVDKNKQTELSRLNDANSEAGDFNLTFDRLDSVSTYKKLLVMENRNANTYESVYQYQKPDSLLQQIKDNPFAFKGKKLNITYIKQGVKMIYKGGKLGTF